MHSVLTSRFGLDGGAMFGIIPKPMWAKKVPVDDLNRIDMVTRSLLIVGKGRNILVDTGNGDKWPEKLREIYRIDTDSVNIESSLEAYGLAEKDVTDVILTHLHFDHAGGSTRIEGGELVPTFPNARYYVQRQNYQHANSPNDRDRASYLAENWRPLQQRGVLELVDGPREILPGIHVKISDGHTPGQQLPFLSEGDVTVLYCGDLFPTHVHVPVPWIMGYDLAPLTIIEEKKQVLAQAVAGNWIFFYGHDHKHAATRVTRSDKGFTAGAAVNF